MWSQIRNKLLNGLLLASLAMIVGCIPEQEIAKQAPELAQVEEATQIAILMPITAEKSRIGSELAKMIKLGMENNSATKIKYAIYDSSTPELLLESIDKIKAKGTDIIIGPLYSKATKITSDNIADTAITMVSLSNNPTLASPNCYMAGHAPMQQIDVLLNYLVKNNFKSYLALLPAGSYSRNMAAIIKDRLKADGAKLLKAEFYDEETLHATVLRVAAVVDELNEQDYHLNQPVLLLADDPETMKQVWRHVRAQNLDQKSLVVGDGRINQTYLKNAQYIYTGNVPVTYNQLMRQVRSLGIENLNFLHYVAYDAGAMVTTKLGVDKYNQRDFTRNMNELELFEGMSGFIQFEDNIALRKYELINRNKDDYNIIEQVNN